MIDASEIIIYADDPVDWPRIPVIGKWEFYEVPWFRSSPCLDRIVMRRKVDGQWQYRAMTSDESSDLASSLAW